MYIVGIGDKPNKLVLYTNTYAGSRIHGPARRMPNTRGISPAYRAGLAYPSRRGHGPQREAQHGMGLDGIGREGGMATVPTMRY